VALCVGLNAAVPLALGVPLGAIELVAVAGAVAVALGDELPEGLAVPVAVAVKETDGVGVRVGL